MRHFRSLDAFGNHLLRLAAAGPAVVHHIADQAGGLVERAAKAKIGVYQAAAGPFNAWAPLAASTEAQKVRLGYKTGRPLLRTGDLRDSISHVAEGPKTVVGSTDKVMVYQEFGTSRIPPRPVLGPAMFENQEHIAWGAGGIVATWLASGGWRRTRIRSASKRSGLGND